MEFAKFKTTGEIFREICSACDFSYDGDLTQKDAQRFYEHHELSIKTYNATLDVILESLIQLLSDQNSENKKAKLKILLKILLIFITNISQPYKRSMLHKNN